jgi:DNA-binding FadR family transcriptional regulator
MPKRRTDLPSRAPRRPTALRPIARRPVLVEQVVARLREAILNGEYPPDSVLPSEGTLCESLGVSYTVVREAMRVLRSQGLVEVSQGRRPRVKPAGTDVVRDSLETMLRRNSASLDDLTEVRRPLECEIAALAAVRATPEHMAAMEQAIADQQAASTRDEQVATDMQFHEWLARAAGNPVFLVMLSSVAGLLWESRRKVFAHVGIKHAIEGHRAVLEAVRRRDASAARQAMLSHMQMIVQDLGHDPTE